MRRINLLFASVIVLGTLNACTSSKVSENQKINSQEIAMKTQEQKDAEAYLADSEHMDDIIAAGNFIEKSHELFKMNTDFQAKLMETSSMYVKGEMSAPSVLKILNISEGFLNTMQDELDKQYIPKTSNTEVNEHIENITANMQLMLSLERKTYEALKSLYIVRDKSLADPILKYSDTYVETSSDLTDSVHFISTWINSN